MQILVDHNMRGLAKLLFETLKQDEWIEWVNLLELQFVYFEQVGLHIESKDDEIWRLAQSGKMLILTNNRNCDDETSLTAVIDRENTATSLPIITVGNAGRLWETAYRHAAVLNLINILAYLDDHLGRGRIYIP